MKEIKNSAALAAAKERSGFLGCFSAPVAQHARLFVFSPGEYIAEEGVLPEYLFYMASGRAKLYVTMPNGKIALIDFFSAPCFIGEMELVGVRRDICSVQAIEPCECLALPVSAWGPALLRDPVFLRHICLHLGNKNAKNIRASAKNQNYPLKNRLAVFILLASASGRYLERHTHAADYLGVSYRHFLYVIANFVREGLLAKDSGGYRIKNRAALLELALAADPELISALGERAQ